MKHGKSTGVGSGLVVVSVVAVLTGWRLAARAADNAEPPPARVATVEHLMEGIQQPHCGAIAALLKDSGPKDDKGWSELAEHAAILNESGHLLVENQRCPDAVWAGAAGAQQKSAADLFAAAEKKDMPAAEAAFKGVTGACKTCHAAHKKPPAPPVSERPALIEHLMEEITKPNCASLGKLLKDAGPSDDASWAAVVRHAAILNEAGHLLMQNGRCPDAAWAQACGKLREQSSRVIRAGTQKDIGQAREAFTGVTGACGDCHKAHRKSPT